MSERSDRAEAAATRRRWVSLAELVAVAGVLIGALTLWNSWSERRDAEAEKHATATQEAAKSRRIDLTATVGDGGRTLTLKDEAHDIRDVAFAFPTALGVAPQQPVADARVDVKWFEGPLLKLTDDGADDRTGRLPTLVGVQYWDGDRIRRGTAIYDIVWRTEGRVLRGRALRLEGFKLNQRGGTQTRLDALWKRRGV